jgi:hypothetical protein
MKLRSCIAWGIRDFLGFFIALNRNARVELEGQLPDHLNDSRIHRRRGEGSIRRCGRSNRRLDEAQGRAVSKIGNGIGKVGVIQDVVSVAGVPIFTEVTSGRLRLQKLKVSVLTFE